MRSSWLLGAIGVPVAIASCSVYGTNLVGSGGAGATSASSPAASSSGSLGGAGGMTNANTSSQGGTGGAGGSAGIGGAGGMASTSSTSTTSTSTSTSSTSTSSSSSTTSTSTSSSGSTCNDPSQCPGSTTICQQPACSGGVCGTTYTTLNTPTPMQTPGDCQTLVCDGQGNVIPQENDADLPTPTNDCTTGACTAGVPVFPPKTAGAACNSNGGKVCDGMANCVQCLVSTDCASLICHANMCVTSTCTNHVKDGTETDVDCGGGACSPCPVGDTCVVNADCASGTCAGGVCVESCSDGLKDGQETDVDCGGPVCSPCVLGKKCGAGTDCQSARCTAGSCVDGLLISQLQTRGLNGGNDELVEIYNPGTVAVTFDSTWTIKARSAVGTCTSDALGTRFSGTGQSIPAHGHLLYANSSVPGYSEATLPDGTYTIGITDASSVLLSHGSTVVDALCFYFDTTTQTALTSCATAYTCAGTPIMNPHNNMTNTDSDASLERLPGGAGGNTKNTGNNAADFAVNNAPDPHDLGSLPVP